MKARKKPVVIEFIKWNGGNISEVLAFGENKIEADIKTSYIEGTLYRSANMFISTIDGTMHANIGDYIIKGVNGEFYPCKPDIFEKVYDILPDNIDQSF